MKKLFTYNQKDKKKNQILKYYAFSFERLIKIIYKQLTKKKFFNFIKY